MRRNYRSVLPWIFLFSFALPVSAQIMIGRTASPPDLAGEWVLIGYEDQGAVGGLQPNPDDYLGVPFNEAGRMRSDTTAESILGMTEFQCLVLLKYPVLFALRLTVMMVMTVMWP